MNSKSAAVRGWARPFLGTCDAVFLFFSNRAGCLPSLVISAVITIILLFATGVLR